VGDVEPDAMHAVTNVVKSLYKLLCGYTIDMVNVWKDEMMFKTLVNGTPF